MARHILISDKIWASDSNQQISGVTHKCTKGQFIYLLLREAPGIRLLVWASLADRNIPSTSSAKGLLKGWGGGRSQEKAFATLRAAAFRGGAGALLPRWLRRRPPPPADVPSCRAAAACGRCCCSCCCCQSEHQNRLAGGLTESLVHLFPLTLRL